MMQKIGFSIICVLISLTGCAHLGQLNVNLSENIKIPPKRVIVFFVDGLREDFVRKLSSAGQLKNIKHYIIDRGCYIQNAVTCIPSITYAVTASMQTGKFPGHHQILGNKWFDRNTGKYQNYMFIRTYQQINNDLLSPTIFELLNDKFTVAIQTACYRGATRPIDNWASSGINWFFNRIMTVDQLVAIRFELIAQCSKCAGRWPDYIFAYFPACDEIGHRFGSNSKQYIEAIKNVDKQIGRICNALEKNKLLDNYYLILISDHGHVPVDKKRFWSPSDFIKRNLKIPFVDNMFLENADFCAREKFLRNYRLVLVNGGYRRASLYIRCTDSWADLPKFDDIVSFTEKYAPAFGSRDLLGTLSNIPAVALVAVRKNANSAYIITQTGKADIIRKIVNGKKYYAYKTITGNPLKYPKKLLDGTYKNADDWLIDTSESEFPDFVPQIVEFFDSPRAGDIVLFAARGWDFSSENLGGHGSVIREDMIVPFIIAGPGIRKKTLKTARVVDLMPTVLDMLNCSDRANQAGLIDGHSLLKKLCSRH